MSSSARIVVFWNPSTIMVDLVDCSSQGIHVVLRSLGSQISFHVTFVYGLHTIVARRDLWDDKLNGSVVSTHEIAGFHKCYLDLGLSDLPYTGCHCTWSNGSIWSKIDRVLVNPLWSALHQSTHVHFGLEHGSFGGPAMYSFCKKLKSLKIPLKRLNEHHFSHISERVSHAEMDLDILQSALHGDPNNQQLALENKEASFASS
ncbi:hypothetical protein OIU76_028422 [Salix suchowensis]|nr:hypothetical protein OIU76_028422 [Salix suchowensis]